MIRASVVVTIRGPELASGSRFGPEIGLSISGCGNGVQVPSKAKFERWCQVRAKIGVGIEARVTVQVKYGGPAC